MKDKPLNIQAMDKLHNYAKANRIQSKMHSFLKVLSIALAGLGLSLFSNVPAQAQGQYAGQIAETIATDENLEDQGWAEASERMESASRLVPISSYTVPALRETVSLHLEGASVEQALRQIIAETNLKLSYGSDAVAGDKKITLHLDDVTAHKALREVVRGTDLKLMVSRSGQIVVVKNSEASSIRAGYNPVRLAMGHGRSSKLKMSPLLELSPLRIQTGTITGTVTDSQSGETIPGVNVVIVGTQQGAATDTEGNYTITNVEAGTYDLSATFIGYAPQTVEGVDVIAGETVEVDFALQMSTLSLEEVVAVGYGEQQRKDLTGSVSSVTAEEIESLSVPSVEGALQGQASGVQVRQKGGNLEGDFDVMIRGVGSTGNSQPLYVVDGVPLFSGSLSTLNLSDIESMEILKDASATAIYGARASNGVVLITTKMGRSGDTKVNFSAEYGQQQATKTIDMMNAEQFKELFIDAYQNDGRPLPSELTDPDFPLQSNNWQDLILRTAPSQKYNLSVTGGDSKTQFAVSGGYTNRQGIILDTYLQRISLRANIDHEVNSSLKVGTRLAGSSQWREGMRDDNPFGGAHRTALIVKPWIPYKDEDGEWADLPPRRGATFGLVSNPVAKITREIRNFKDNRFVGSAFAEYEIVKGLQLRTNLGADLLFEDNYFYEPVWTKGGNFHNPVGEVQIQDGDQINWVADQTLTFNKIIGEKHLFRGLVGGTVQQYTARNLSVNASGTTNDNLREISNQPNVSGAAGAGNKIGLMSYFTRVNYDYDGKYLLTATVRRDGSSRFGPGNRFGTFPSASVGWRISEEPFMRGLSLIDDLKLRTSYGLTGNQAIGDFQFLARAASDLAVWGNTLAEGNAPVSYANPNLRWEANKQFDVGVDLTVLNGRISLTADYYNKVSEGLLVAIPVPRSNGITSFQTVNLGSVRNRGVEFAFDSQNLVGEFSWTTGFNIATNANETLNIGTNAAGEPLEIPGRKAVPGYIINLTKEGHPIGAFHGYIFDGIWQADEAQEAAQYGVEPGDSKFRDLNGDQQITPADQTFLGQPQPAWYGGMTNTFGYKNVTLSVFVNWQAGHKLYNAERAFTESGYPNFNQRATMVNRWTPENPSNKYPKAHDSKQWKENGRGGTRYLEDASFLRVSNVSLGYRLPDRWLSGMHFDRAAIILSGTNLFTFTEYSGLDPESSSRNSPLSAGQDITPYPLAKTYSLRLNFTF